MPDGQIPKSLGLLYCILWSPAGLPFNTKLIIVQLLSTCNLADLTRSTSFNEKQIKSSSMHKNIIITFFFFLENDIYCSLRNVAVKAATA